MKPSFYEREADRNRYFSVMKSTRNRTPAHFHNAMEIVAVTEGKERVVINGTERILSKGELGVSNSFDVHYYDAVGDSEVTVVMLSDEYTARFRKTFEERLPNFFCAGERSRELLALVEKLYEVRDENRLIVSGYVDVLLGTLYDARTTVGKTPADGNRVVGILRFLDEHFAEKLTICSVADRFGYSANYFSALFNRFTGMHFRDYLNRLRVARASLLIEGGEAAGSAIGRCGFDSPNTYYRAKKKWENS